MAEVSLDTIHVLHVDDDPGFVGLAAKFIERHDERVNVETALNPTDALDHIRTNSVHCVVSDYDMPERNGIEFLKAVRKEFPDLPFILYSGKGSEEVASDAISAGVTDYFQKKSGTDQYAVLTNRICNAVEATRFERTADQRQHHLDQILKAVPGCVVRIDYDGQFVFANQRAKDVLGLEPGDVAARTYNDPEWHITDMAGDPIPDEELPFRQVRDSGKPLYGYRHMVEWPDGTRKALQVNGAPLFDDGDVQSTVFAITDITEQVARERELRQTTRRLNLALEATDTGVWEWNIRTDEVVWNGTLERMLGIEPGTFDGTYEAQVEYIHPEDVSLVERSIDEALDHDGVFQVEFRMEREDGKRIWVEGRGKPFADDGSKRMTGTITNITNRKDSEKALARREVLDPSVALEFHSDQLARTVLGQTDGTIEFSMEGVVPQSDGTQLLYVSVRGSTVTASQAILDAIPTVEDSRLLSTVGDSARYKISVGTGSLATTFARFGGVLQSLEFGDDTCEIAGEFPETVEPEAVTEAVRETYPDMELASQRRVIKPAFLREIMNDRLTERQRTVLGMAHYSGYFDQPRQSTGDELAGQLGITRQTFNTHLRKAQARVFHATFDEAVELPS